MRLLLALTLLLGLAGCGPSSPDARLNQAIEDFQSAIEERDRSTVLALPFSRSSCARCSS